MAGDADDAAASPGGGARARAYWRTPSQPLCAGVGRLLLGGSGDAGAGSNSKALRRFSVAAALRGARVRFFTRRAGLALVLAAAAVALVVTAIAAQNSAARLRATRSSRQELLPRDGGAHAGVDADREVAPDGRAGLAGRPPRHLSIADYPAVYVADSPPFRPPVAVAEAMEPPAPGADNALSGAGGAAEEARDRNAAAPPLPPHDPGAMGLAALNNAADRSENITAEDAAPVPAANANRQAAHSQGDSAPKHVEQRAQQEPPEPGAALAAGAQSPVPKHPARPHNGAALAHTGGELKKPLPPLPRPERVPAASEVAISNGVDPAAEPLLRIIVLTMNRTASLKRLFVSLTKADYEGDRVDLDIWIDRSNDPAIAEGAVEASTVTARECHWPHGVRTIHRREQNAGLYEQWIYSWNVTDESTEAAVILEDDLEVSPFFYVWLKRARLHYHSDPSVAAFTLQRGELRPRRPKGSPWTKLYVNQSYPVFKYKLLGTWGFAPQKAAWLDFRAWLEEMRQRGAKPYVNDLITTQWYVEQEAKAGGDYAPAMWSQWFIKFSDVKRYYSVYANLPNNTTLASNYREGGLHYVPKSTSRGADFPVFRGPASSLRFPRTLVNLDWDGTEEDPDDFAAQLSDKAADSAADKGSVGNQVADVLPGAVQSPAPVRRLLRL